MYKCAHIWTEVCIKCASHTHRQRCERELISTSLQDGDGIVVLNLSHLQGAFYLLFLGHGAALILLLLEVFVDRVRGESRWDKTNDEGEWKEMTMKQSRRMKDISMHSKLNQPFFIFFRRSRTKECCIFRCIKTWINYFPIYLFDLAYIAVRC